ncbi:hypothetical protein CHU95_21465 [Niveispirillum lacus]|uniref:Uncharacterized protein n=1 Tax=Niveispirillum lacus TaxID=1981099 RepID=A0A255YR56_9PROT|nr:hypothetical protein [Niveispirillum lacus]OYQ31706.1 hypothetical protein CHU95_21465 [Niveispirillum lacus]
MFRPVTILALALFLALPAHAAPLVVVEAKGTDLTPGATIDDKVPLTLADGARLVLIGEDGSQVTLRGPFKGTPVSVGQGATQPLAGLLSARGNDTTSLGAVRDAGTPGPLPDAWVIDPAVSGAVCVKPGQELVLWRADSAKAASLTLMPADRAWTANAEWPAGEGRLALPELPITDGGTLLFELDGTASAVTFHQLPTSISAPKMAAGWMAAKQCDRQARALLAAN